MEVVHVNPFSGSDPARTIHKLQRGLHASRINAIMMCVSVSQEIDVCATGRALAESLQKAQRTAFRASCGRAPRPLPAPPPAVSSTSDGCMSCGARSSVFYVVHILSVDISRLQQQQADDGHAPIIARVLRGSVTSQASVGVERRDSV